MLKKSCGFDVSHTTGVSARVFRSWWLRHVTPTEMLTNNNSRLRRSCQALEIRRVHSTYVVFVNIKSDMLDLTSNVCEWQYERNQASQIFQFFPLPAAKK